MRIACCAAAIVLLAAEPGVHAQVDLAALLARAAAYIATFDREFGSVVAEERYEQDIRPAIAATGTSTRRSGGGPVHTVLVSDFLLVQVAGEGWWPFRDVFERDGKPVRDRQDRLTALFLTGSQPGLEQATKIMNESARYNIGDVSRNINVPTLPLPFLGAPLRGQFAFTEGKRDDVSDGRVIEYREVGRPTVIRTTNERDLPVYGRFWIDEDTGTVRRTELHAIDTFVEAHIVVVYQLDEGIGAWAPARMEERYKRQRDSNEVRGVATYSKFRRFKVTTSEDIPK
jgi:hypothetical protein